MKAKTLVQAWLEVELGKNNKSLADALRDLNKHLQSAHTHSRVREWEDNRNGRGERLPRKVRQYMGRVVIKEVLQNAGLNTKGKQSRALNRIVDMLS